MFNRGRSEADGGKEEPTREVSTCTDSSIRSEISHGEELDRDICGEERVEEDESIW